MTSDKDSFGENQKNYFTVSEMSGLIKHCLRDNPVLNEIYVRGEIIDLKRASSGHIYFTIQDKQTDDVLKCTFWKYDQKKSYELIDGLDVLVFGSIGTHSPWSVYKMDVLSVLDMGLGELIRKKEELKKKVEEKVKEATSEEKIKEAVKKVKKEEKHEKKKEFKEERKKK